MRIVYNSTLIVNDFTQTLYDLRNSPQANTQNDFKANGILQNQIPFNSAGSFELFESFNVTDLNTVQGFMIQVKNSNPLTTQRNDYRFNVEQNGNLLFSGLQFSALGLINVSSDYTITCPISDIQDLTLEIYVFLKKG